MGINKVNYGNTTLIDISNDTVTAGSMISGTTAHDNSGAAITGTIASKSSSDLTASGATVTAPAGYYASSASKSVASGTAGTPTATKGSVSNHSVSVTPSVTNTAGYISGGTKTGTAVSVSASELVSGNKAITANGTGIDVANYSTVSVSVDGGFKKATSPTISDSSNSGTMVFSNIAAQPSEFYVYGVIEGTAITYLSSYYMIFYIFYDGSTTEVWALGYSSSKLMRVKVTTVTWAYNASTQKLTITRTGGSDRFKTAMTAHMYYK